MPLMESELPSDFTIPTMIKADEIFSYSLYTFTARPTVGGFFSLLAL